MMYTIPTTTCMILLDVQNRLKEWTDVLLGWMGVSPVHSDGLNRWMAFLLVVLLAAVFDFLCRKTFVRGLRRVVLRTRVTWDDELFSHEALCRTCHILSALLVIVVLPVVFGGDGVSEKMLMRFMHIYFIVTVLRLANTLLASVFRIVSARPAWQNKPIKGLRQTAQGIVMLIGGVLIVSILIDKSPAIFLTGLGASAAVVMLIFRDSILGFVSGIQLAANDMLQVGDWIAVPKYGANGTVLEVSLTTVKIRNWDNTVVTLPPYLLVSDSFQNWQAMRRSGGRRVMRSVSIDMTSVRFCTPEMLERYRRIDLIRDYVDQLARSETHPETRSGADPVPPSAAGSAPAAAVSASAPADALQSGSASAPGGSSAGASVSDSASGLSGPRITNLGIFRAYMRLHLQHEVPVNKHMTLMVRELEPTQTGLPLQLYFFTDTVDWITYESIQADVFDHLLACIHEFDLRVFQSPSGHDVELLRGRISGS